MGIWVSFQSVHGFRLTELIYAIRYFCACRTTGLGSLRGPYYPHSPRLELFTTRSSGRPIRFLRIVTPHTGRGKTAHAVDAHELIVALSILTSDESYSCCVWYLKSIILFNRSKLSIQSSSAEHELSASGHGDLRCHPAMRRVKVWWLPCLEVVEIEPFRCKMNTI